MSALLFYILALPFFYLVSLLPFPLLYLFSDFCFIILYYVIGYRKKVVLQNLRNSFPNKTEAELLSIRKKFYRYYCDFLLETFKILTITRRQMLKRCRFTPESLAIFAKFANEGKSTVLAMGHTGNWEWSAHSFAMSCRQDLYALYHPMGNKQFNNLMYRMRTRFGAKMIPMKYAYKDMIAHKNDLTTTVFIADQTPMPEHAYWTTFLNQDTPIFKGTETIAKKLDRPVLYACVKKIRRGYYDVHVEVLTESPRKTADGEISELHTRRLELDIIDQPETWLWSHRRWKHKRPASV